MAADYENALDARYLGSRSATGPITLTGANDKVGASPHRLTLIIFAPATASLRILPGTNSDPGGSGILMQPGDPPMIFDVRVWGDAVRESFLLVGTAADIVLITEVMECPCIR